tara:strand:+ start:46 stop:654 length:609 start_codon:yes stop_codon:yes gene_type:complete
MKKMIAKFGRDPKNMRDFILFIVSFLLLPFLMGWDMKIVVSVGFVVIIVVIMYIFWFDTTKDDINNEEQKTSFLNEKFDYLVNSVVECEGRYFSFWLMKRKKKKVKYKVTDIIIHRPRKIKEDEWKVLIEMRDLSPWTPFLGLTPVFLETDTIKVLNISDIELDKIMTNEKGFNSITNTIQKTMGGQRLTILNPDVFKKDEN